MKLMKTLVALMMALSCLPAVAQQASYAKYTSGLPFRMTEVKAPVIPANQVSLSDYGAKGDGLALCTEAFQKAIADLSGRGGGHLNVPQGVWLTGPIKLQSNIDLHLENGAIILFSGDIRLYPVIETVYEGGKRMRSMSPITGTGLTNVSITGHGVIDGNGACWRPLKKEKVTESQWKKITGDGGVFPRPTMWYPSEERVNTRPVMVHLENCKNVLLQGVIFQNSPAWNIHPLMCENLIVDGITAKNPAYAQNGDAIDVESCKNVLIVNSTFDAGDDCICIKSGRDAEGRQRGMPTQNVVVSGCTVFNGHGAFVVGSEMSGGVKNIMVRDCQFIGTDAGLRFKSCRGRGGVVEKIYIQDISMFNILGDAITFDLYYGGKSVIEAREDGTKVNNIEPKPVDVTTPEFRDISISRVNCHGARRAIFFNGLPEKPISNVTLTDINIVADEGADYFNCQNVVKKDVTVNIPKSKGNDKTVTPL